MSQENRVPIDPAAVTLMASIVAKSLSQYNEKNPGASLSETSAVREISENVAVDMISAVAHLASQVAAVGEAPTRPQSPAAQRAANAYRKVDSFTKDTSNSPKSDFLGRLNMSPEEEQHPETD